MKKKLTLDLGAVQVDSFRMEDGGDMARGTVQGHAPPSAQCPTAACTVLYGGYTCPNTCAYSCAGSTCYPCLN
ncbi:MAG TPA: hypothetical protein VM759_09290 [Longimicrobium sp.]|nr:hypothetical protein [Longimicrobium sp.]